MKSVGHFIGTKFFVKKERSSFNWGDPCPPLDRFIAWQADRSCSASPSSQAELGGRARQAGLPMVKRNSVSVSQW